MKEALKYDKTNGGGGGDLYNCWKKRIEDGRIG